MPHDIEITGLNRVEKPKPNKAGDKILAYFDCTVGPVAFRGCAFVIREDGFLTIWEPRLTELGFPRAVWINDPAIKGCLVNKARGVFEALGGNTGQPKRNRHPLQNA